MAKGILGKKIGMTQIFSPEGRAIPVTVIEAGPCLVVQKKSVTTDGYDAIQLGFSERKERLVNKPLKGHFDKAKVKPCKFLREIRIKKNENYDLGQEIKADIFKEGELVDIIGTSKGKGFSGVIKRWNFNRAPISHGSMYHRRPGSLGATDPARVFKGRKMPGHLGNERITLQRLQIVRVDAERNLILIKGSVPGAKGGMIMIKETLKSVKK